METSNQKISITKLDQDRLKSFFTRDQNSFDLKKNIKVVAEKLENKAVDPKKIPPTVVTMNSKVKVKNLLMGKTMALELVYPDSVDIKQNKISIFSPLGASLFGHSKGNEFAMASGNGRIKFVIEEIIYQPESAGDYHL